MIKQAAAIKRMIEDAFREFLANGIPADRLKNQVRGAVLPPTGNTGSGYTPGDTSVTTGKIADGAVTIPKLSFDPATQTELDAEASTRAAADTALAVPQYLTLALSGTLTNERRLVAGTGISITDGGANGDATIASSGLTNPMTTQDDIIVGGASGTPARLAKGSDSQVLTVDPTTHHLVWATPSGGGGGATVNTGADASKGTGTSGDLYLPNDGVTLYRSTGSAQAPWGPIFPLHDPTLQSWSWVNQGGASVDTTHGGIYLLAPANGGMSMRIRAKAVPTAPYLIDIMFLPAIFPENYGLISFGWRDSGGGGLVHARFGWVSDWQLAHIYSNSATADNSAPQQTPWGRSAPRFIRLQDDSTNRKVWFSEDGQHWLLYYSESRTAFLTPDQVFFGADTRTGSHDCGVTLLSWYEH